MIAEPWRFFSVLDILNLKKRLTMFVDVSAFCFLYHESCLIFDLQTFKNKTSCNY